MSYKQKFSERLKQARERFHLSQAELAARLGVSPGAVGNWEKGQTPTNARLRVIADSLCVSQGWLLGEGDAILRETPPVEYAADPNPLRYLTAKELHDKAMQILADEDLELAERARRANLFLEELAKRKSSP